MSASVILLLLLVSFSNFMLVINAQGLKEVFNWKTLDWKFKTKQDRQSAIENERFVPGNSMPVAIEYVYGRIFITTPRLKEGIPATLSTIHESQIGCGDEGPKSPLLRPYPSWRWNNGDMACDGLTSVFSVKADVCGRLWVLDSGVVDILNPYRTTVCSTKIAVFDLASDKLIRTYNFGDYILKSNSILLNLAVDVITCEQVYVYSADPIEFGLIVTDAVSGDSWRVENKLFYPYPNWGTLIDHREYLDIMMGVTSLALDHDYNPNTRKLYFHSLSGARENFVATYILQNHTLAATMPQEFFFSNGEAQSQMPNSVFDSRGILFFGLVSSNSLACWNPALDHIPENIITVAQSDEALQFISGLSVDHLSILWTLSNKYVSFVRGTLNPEHVNYRIFVANTRDLTQGTQCEYGYQQQQYSPPYMGGVYPSPHMPLYPVMYDPAQYPQGGGQYYPPAGGQYAAPQMPMGG